jgi:hypothetical protein
MLLNMDKQKPHVVHVKWVIQYLEFDFLIHIVV